MGAGKNELFGGKGVVLLVIMRPENPTQRMPQMPQRTENPYAALCINQTASGDDIRQAYRKFAKDNHPDVCPGDKQAEERFKRVTNAFNFLSSPETRRRFDCGEIDADGNPTRHSMFGGAPGGGGHASRSGRGFSSDNPRPNQGQAGIFSGTIFGSDQDRRSEAEKAKAKQLFKDLSGKDKK